jgi:Cys-tRNA(Pro)/Cys-tRNA(Cys) deacylase
MTQHIERYLNDHQIPYRIHEHAPIVTFDEAKATLPFKPTLMVKGLAFAMPHGNIAIIALRATDRANYRKISDTLGVRRADLRMATPEELETTVGMQVGGVAPIPVDNAEIYVDRAVLDLDRIICGTGRRDASLELTGPDFRRITIQEVGDYHTPAA